MSKKLDIISLYLADYHLSFTGREIARKIKASPQAGLNILNELVGEKIISKEIEGRNAKYRLNLSLYTKNMLQLAETNKAKQALSDFELRSVLEKFLPYAETIIIFGSFARGRQSKQSDLDLIIINGKKKKILEAKKIFPIEINIEFSTWAGFLNALRNKAPLALEIKKNHLAYGNVFKLVDIYSE